MSLRHKVFDFDVSDEKCFHCSKTVKGDEVAIHWIGSTTTIFFHPTCALQFSLRFMRDLHELDIGDELTETYAAKKPWPLRATKERSGKGITSPTENAS